MKLFIKQDEHRNPKGITFTARDEHGLVLGEFSSCFDSRQLHICICVIRDGDRVEMYQDVLPSVRTRLLADKAARRWFRERGRAMLAEACLGLLH